MKTLIKISGLFLAFLFFILNVGCSGGASTALPDLTPGSGGGSIPGTSNGTASADDFFISVDSTNNSIAQVHTAASFATKCAASKTLTTNTDISCIIDSPEGDVYNKGVVMSFHAPQGMCNYLERSTYWYWNQPVGYGPTNIVINATVSGSTTVSYNCAVDGGAIDPSCASQPELVLGMTNATAPALGCVYDTSNFVNGQNCCFGNRTVVLRITDQVTGLIAPPVTTKSTWGGKFSDCIGGAGLTSWSAKLANGYPVPVVSSALNGFDEKYAIVAPIKKQIASNISVANYYDPTLHTHAGYYLTGIPNTSTKPYYVEPVDDLSGTAVPSGNDAYTFSCLDAGYEIKHRIKVYIREWDTYPDYLNFISSAGATVVPDRGAASTVEPSGCAGIAGPCDDFHDADDFLLRDVNLGAYDTSVATGLPKRTLYFPKEIYSQ